MRTFKRKNKRKLMNKLEIGKYDNGEIELNLSNDKTECYVILDENSLKTILNDCKSHMYSLESFDSFYI